MTERIGIICGMEQSFPAAFIEKVNSIPGFSCEFAKLGGINETHKPDFKVLVDRISHEVPYYRIFLKTAALAGTYVINDPFWWSADDKFFGYTLAAKLGIKVPRTVLLPQHSYIPAINPQKSLRNLEFPLDWEAIVDYVKFPAILKPAEGGGWKNVSLVHNLNELWSAYNQSGQLAMTLQQYIDFDNYVRCLCIGKEFILPIKYDPKRRCYVDADGFLSKDLEKKILDGSWALNNALGYDMNSVEFAIQDGVPYAIDFTNPAPDFDVNSILPKYFKVAVDEMAKLVTRAAKEGRKNNPGYNFRKYLDKPVPRPVAAAAPAKKSG
ncbi:MAG TPA: hypothetical protein VGK67_12895 [Myxococcales bacterium]